jgi:hypothetical protein
MSSPDPQVASLRTTLEQLVAENARLREQLAAASAGVPVRASSPGSALPSAGRAGSAEGGRHYARRRRWIGKAISVLLLLVGMAVGAFVASRDGSLTNRVFRAGYEDGAAAARARNAEPAAP